MQRNRKEKEEKITEPDTSFDPSGLNLMADTSSVWPYLQKQTLIKIRRYAARQCNSIKEFTREGVKLQSRWNFPEIELSFFSAGGQFQSSTKNDQKKIAFKILSCKQL